MRRLFLLAPLALALAAPTEASALTATLAGVEEAERQVTGEGCNLPGRVRVTLPLNATAIKTNFPAGSGLFDTADINLVARIAAVQVTRGGRSTTVTWTALGSDSTCDPATQTGFPWESDEYTFRAQYKQRERVTLPRGDIGYYSGVALGRKFGQAYTTADKRERCRRTSSITGRCRVSWFQGDTVWSGRTRIWMNVRRGKGRDGSDQIWWNYAMRIRRTNEYCVFALKRPLRKCSKTISVR